MVATPNLTFTITPPGGSTTDYTQYLAWSGAHSQITITQNFGRQGDTAVFPLVDEFVTTPHFWIPVFSQVKLVDNAIGQTLFAGVVTKPIQDATSPTRNEWTLQCVDYTFYADNSVVHGTFIGQTVDQIIVSLTAQANCGITAKQLSHGGYVAPGPQLASFVLNYATLSDAWRRLATLAGQVTPYGWYVDENRKLHFYDSTTALSSGVTFTTIPTAVNGSTTEGHIYAENSFGYEWDGTSVRNRILVQGANQAINYGSVATSKPTDVWVGTGYQTAWPLRYTVTGSPVLYVGGVSKSVTTVNAGSSSNATWQVIQDSIGKWSLVTTGAAPRPGVVIKIWYDYLVPVTAAANDYASQHKYTGPNAGVFTEYINDTSLTTVPMALARAMRQRTEYADAVERITFTCGEDFLGWVRAGETCTVRNTLVRDVQNNQWGVWDQFIVIGNTVTFVAGGYRQCQITAVRL